MCLKEKNNAIKIKTIIKNIINPIFEELFSIFCFSSLYSLLEDEYLFFISTEFFNLFSLYGIIFISIYKLFFC